MALLGQLLGSVLGAGSNPTQQQNTLQAVVDLIHHPSVGGIAGLSGLFQNAGLGQLMQGWVNNGPNPPVSASQLSQVLGPERIAEFASKLGIPPDQAVQHLSQLLPQVIDHLTPNGTASAPNSAASAFALLKSKLLGG